MFRNASIFIIFLIGCLLFFGRMLVSQKNMPVMFVDTCAEKKDYFQLPWSQSVIREEETIVDVVNAKFGFTFEYPRLDTFYQENLVQDTEEFISTPRAVYSMVITPKKSKEGQSEIRYVRVVIFPTYCMSEKQWISMMQDMYPSIQIHTSELWTDMRIPGYTWKASFLHAGDWHYEVQFLSSRGNSDETLTSIWNAIRASWGIQGAGMQNHSL